MLPTRQYPWRTLHAVNDYPLDIADARWTVPHYRGIPLPAVTTATTTAWAEPRWMTDTRSLHTTVVLNGERMVQHTPVDSTTVNVLVNLLNTVR